MIEQKSDAHGHAVNISWAVTDHVCAVCCGRLLKRRVEGKSLYRCSNCGFTRSGSLHSACACGTRIGGANAGIRCVPNPNRGPHSPAAIVAWEVKECVPSTPNDP